MHRELSVIDFVEEFVYTTVTNDTPNSMVVKEVCPYFYSRLNISSNIFLFLLRNELIDVLQAN